MFLQKGCRRLGVEVILNASGLSMDTYGAFASLRLGYRMEHWRLHFIVSTLIHHGGCILALLALGSLDQLSTIHKRHNINHYNFLASCILAQCV
jgi:hypothetical protein